LLSMTKKVPEIVDVSSRSLLLSEELAAFFNTSNWNVGLNKEPEKVLNDEQLKKESFQQLRDFINVSNLKDNLKKELENILKQESNRHSLIVSIIVDIRENREVYSELLKILKNIDITIIDKLLEIFSSERWMDENDDNEVEWENDYNVYYMLYNIRYN